MLANLSKSPYIWQWQNNVSLLYLCQRFEQWSITTTIPAVSEVVDVIQATESIEINTDLTQLPIVKKAHGIYGNNMENIEISTIEVGPAITIDTAGVVAEEDTKEGIGTLEMVLTWDLNNIGQQLEIVKNDFITEIENLDMLQTGWMHMMLLR